MCNILDMMEKERNKTINNETAGLKEWARDDSIGDSSDGPKHDSKDVARELAHEVAEEAVRGNTKVTIPLYQRFKGKQAYGSKTWKVSDKEAKSLKWVIALFIALCILAISLPLFNLPFGVEFVLFFVVVLLAVGIPWLYFLLIIFRHKKDDPIEMHYYDVDYKDNRLTGESYDRTKEITKEEFFSKSDKTPVQETLAQVAPDSGLHELTSTPSEDNNPFEVSE